MPELTQLFPILLTVAIAVIVVVVIVIVVQAVASVRRVRQAGHNPLTLQSDLAVKLLESEALSPERSTSERLGELERLRAEDAISGEEYRAARERVLTGH